MPTPDASFDNPNPHGRRSIITWTAAIALVLFVLAGLVPLDVRDGGREAEMTALEVWREMLATIPDDAPFFLNGPTLSVLSIMALVGSAYVIVAIARLPR